MEGYGKGLIADDRMRERMGALEAERRELKDLCVELEQTLASLELNQEQEIAVVRFAERVKSGLKDLGFDKRQELMQLLVENVTYHRDKAVIGTILPLDGQTGESLLGAPVRAIGWDKKQYVNKAS